jgi:glycosyltransferase involved in cell wall biosynthesis
MISVVTINLNNKVGLEKTISSVISQTYKNVEYIIVDGGSTDGSLSVLERNSEKIDLCISEKDTGVYNAMNKAITKANGDYILFLNSGDYFSSADSLEKIFGYSIDSYDIIYGDMFLETGEQLSSKIYQDKLPFSYFFFHLESLPHPSTLIRRSLFQKVGLYNERFKIVSDWEFTIKALFLYQATYLHIPVAISVFNMSGVSSIPDNSKMITEEKEITYQKYFKGFIDDYESWDKSRKPIIEIVSVRKSLEYSLRRRWQNIKNLFR